MNAKMTHDELLEEIQRLKKRNAELESDYLDALKKNENIKKDIRQAETASLAKSNFLAGMSHEIRTPVNSILTLCDLAIYNSSDPKNLEYLNLIRTSGKSLMEIIGDILDISKIEAGKFELEKISFPLQEIMTDVCSLFAEDADRKNIQLTTYIAPDIPEFLISDPMRIRQILANLVSNALKFTEQGEISVKVTRQIAETADVELRFCVRDTGIGIAPDVRKRLFSPFCQAEDSTFRKYGGTGLGLTICKKLVNMMGGDIWAVSEPGKGSSFYFTIHAGSETAAGSSWQTRQPDNSPVRECVTTPGWGFSPDEFAGVRVLLVEDHPVNRQAAGEILKMAGVGVDMAEDGSDALVMLAENTYDAVFMDVRMPGMDGIEATRKIRGMPELENLPVIAMTAQALREDRTKCLEAGMTDYISKPVDSRRIFEKLRKYLSRPPQAVSFAPVSEPAEPFPDTLPGLDIRTGLERMMGFRHLYTDILALFCEEKRNFVEEFRQTVQSYDMKKALLMAHALKGSADTVAAPGLTLAARAMEEACQRNDTVAVAIHIKSVRKELDIVFDSSEKLLALFPLKKPDSPLLPCSSATYRPS